MRRGSIVSLLLTHIVVSACSFLAPVTQQERLQIRQDMERLRADEFRREQLNYLRRQTSNIEKPK